jgi:hypothetical protein
VRANLETIAHLRREPGDSKVSASLLKHSDEQTVVGLVAVLRAIANGGLAGEDFTRWGVVAAPQRLGRQAVGEVFARVARRGPSGASPLIIPHRSLHSVSGTISEALRIHGPNLSVSGGPANLSEGLLAALTHLGDNRLTGLWLVLTQWDPEPGIEVERDEHAVCTALALALVPLAPGRRGARLCLLCPAEMPAPDDSFPLPPLAELHEVFLHPICRIFRFAWGGGLGVDSSQVLAENVA